MATRNPSTTLTQVKVESESPGHTARLASAAGLPVGCRILSYHEAPPSAVDPILDAQRRSASLLNSRPGGLPSSTSATTNKSRRIPTTADRVLDAPGILDDYYLNLLSWSCKNVLAVALSDCTYVWNAQSGTVEQLAEAPEGCYVTSVDWSDDGAFLGIGLNNGVVELWDVESSTKLRSMAGHQAQVAVLSWHSHLLSSGCKDGSIWHHDVRVARHKVMTLLGHSGEVCGLKWREDGVSRSNDS